MVSTYDAGTTDLGALAGNLPITIYRCRANSDWTFEFVSDDIERLTGYPSNKFGGHSIRSFADIVHPDDQNTVPDEWRAKIERGGTMEWEYRICHADGSIRWVRDTARRVDDEAGNPLWLVGAMVDVTTRIDAEENLRRLLEQAPDAMILVGPDGQITFANAQLANILGHDSVALIGKPIELLVPESKRPRHAEHVANFFGDPKFRPMGSGIELTARHADGRDIPVEVSLSPIEMGGQPLTAASIRDVSDRRRAAQELRASRERLDLIVSATVEGIYDWDVKANRIWLSPRFAELLGHDEVEFLTIEAWHGFVHPDDRPKLATAIQASLAQEKPFRLEYRVRTADGRIRWIDDRANVIGDLDTGVLRVAGSIQDITPRKLDEAALVEREKLLSRIQSLAVIGYWRWELEPGGVVFVSDELRQICGVPPERAIGKLSDLYAQVHPDDRAGLIEFDERLQAEPRDGNFEYRVVGPDGELRYLYETVAAERNDSGAVTGLLGIVQDVTARKRTEEQLIVAQKMEAVGQLTGGIAHDFNNLLGVIQGNIDLIEMAGDDDARRAEHIAAIRRAAERGAALTHGLLAFSRRQTLIPEVVAVNSLVADMVAILEPTVGKELVIETDLAPDIPSVHVDPGQLENALLNLAINARDAMPGDGRLRIATELETLGPRTAADHGVAPGDYLAIRLADTGHGMPASVVERATEPFFTTKETGKGSGLGLSMVHGFAVQSNGFMTIESDVGRGTTVSLFLPTSHDTTLATDNEPSRKAEADAIDGAFEHHGTVLIAEDDEAVRAAAVQMIASLGYRIIEAGDGASALSRLSENPEIDILFTDMIMPGPMNGLDLARECLRLRPEVRILCTSGRLPESGAAMENELQDVRMLKKPYSIATLAEAFEALLKTG